MKTTYIYKPKNLLFLLLIGTLGFAGCKKFLDVNENPNNPDTATPNLLLPVVEASVGQIVGNSFQIYGGIWAQYWTQSPSSSQYKIVDQYNVTNTNFDRVWVTIYRNALENAELIIQSNALHNESMKGMAYILKAYTFQAATDAFGDIPLSEALKGKDIGSPKYEAQKIVYDSVFSYIDKGMALIHTTDPNDVSAADQDIVFHGDLMKWEAFANTLKLRAYLRLSEIDASKARTGVVALYGSNAVFLQADAAIAYSNIGGNENPLFNEIVGLDGVQNLVASSSAVGAFKKNHDPRLTKFYDVLSGDTILSIPQGSYKANSTLNVSPPSALVGARATNIASAIAPVKLISASESYFLQAEAVARGWASSGSVPDLFGQGIKASFTACGLTTTEADTYAATAPDGIPALITATSIEAKVKVIITQKYYAMCGFQGFEAWTEWRRTGYPDFLVPSVASIIGKDIMGKERLPLRLVYPDSELQTNLNYPGTVLVYKPVWWDVKHAN